MKNSSVALIIAFLLIIASLCLTIMNTNNISKLRTQAARESTITGFSIHEISNGNIPFDSCYFNKDTVYFYKNGVLKGKSVTTTTDRYALPFVNINNQ